METSRGFFRSRCKLDIGKRYSGGESSKFKEYKNIPPIIGVLVSRKLATLTELQTVYGVQDAYDLLEIVMIDDYNREVANEANR